MFDNWIWMPHAGHLLVGNECRFRLNTFVNGYIVSTVGEWWPDFRVRELKARIEKKHVDGVGDLWDLNYMRAIGFEDIGYNRKYETMVFLAEASDNNCCPWRQTGPELDMQGYNDAAKARHGHMSTCLRWANKKVNNEA